LASRVVASTIRSQIFMTLRYRISEPTATPTSRTSARRR
jgi:hypothetical protein